MSIDAEQREQSPEESASAFTAHLSRGDIDRLVNFKQRYSLESYGFSTRQATHLLFMRWLYRRGAATS